MVIYANEDETKEKKNTSDEKLTTLYISDIFRPFVATLIGIVNSIAGGSLQLSVCGFVCSYLQNIFCSAERSDSG